jgi:8-oxo-dGTP pyrophosphatase MutT (NUDIX family)
MNYAGAGLILLSSDLASTLLVKDARTGKWGFPKGHRESSDSSDLACAIRECFEETGLTADDYTVKEEVFKISKGGQAYLFRYAVMKNDGRRLRAGPAYEIGDLDWIPLQKLFEAQNIMDGNKYLRTWIADVKASINKKSVNLFLSLLGSGVRLAPTQEPVCPSNIVACS